MTDHLPLLNEKSTQCIDDSFASASFAKLIAKYGVCDDGTGALDVCFDLKVIFAIAVVQVAVVIIQPIIGPIPCPRHIN